MRGLLIATESNDLGCPWTLQ